MTDTPAATEAAATPAADTSANPTPAPAPAGASATAAATPAPAAPSDNTTSGTSASSNADGATEAKPPESQPSLLEAAETKKPEAKPEAKSESRADDKKSDAKDAPPPADAKSDDKKDDAKAPDAAKEATADAPPAPVKYDAFKLPDGVKLDDKALGKYTDILGSSQVKQEDAQKLIDLYISELKEANDAATKHQRDVWSKLNDTWKADTRKEFGNHIETTLATAKAVIEEYGGSPEQVRDLLAHATNNGMGNYAGFVRLLHNIGKALNVYEDSSVPANPAAPKMPKGNPGSGKTGWYKDTMGNGATAP